MAARRDDSVALSKTLSWLLRHGAASVGLRLREDGFARLDDVLAVPRVAHFAPSLARIQEVRGPPPCPFAQIVANDAKQRYRLQQDDAGAWWIRANQGHTLRVRGEPSRRLRVFRTMHSYVASFRPRRHLSACMARTWRHGRVSSPLA